MVVVMMIAHPENLKGCRFQQPSDDTPVRAMLSAARDIVSRELFWLNQTWIERVGIIVKRSVFVVAAVSAAVVLSGCDDTTKTGSAPTPSSTLAAPVVPSLPDLPLLNRQAGNGEVVQQDGLTGAGSLDIDNGNDVDCAIVVTNGDPKSPQATIYVRANSKATLTGIEGTYYVYMKSGEDWDQATLSFTRDQQFSKFDDAFDGDSDWEITLQKSIGGNASTSDVPAF
ncbi:hypothetical protein ACFC06_16485 [Nocardia sp. NPDC056064]|uniref:hypothetical protein n=1 Tax=Nocardia sp. NPDC056064 TaxID=3345701 RepID=UPI0035D7B448